jgi:hypothetical protein
MTKITKLNIETNKEVTIEFYDTIETLPIKRYQLLQKYSLIDGGIGSTMEDVLRHFNKFDNFLEAGDLESIAVERENLLMNFSFIIDGESTFLYMLGAMIKSIDGVAQDVNDDTIDELVDLIECLDISYYEVDKVVEAQKKSLLRA